MSEYKSQPFKNWFDVTLARRFGEEIQAIYRAFPLDRFVAQVAAKIEPLELKDRVAVFSQALFDHLPSPYPTALEILLETLPPVLPAEDGMFKDGFYLMPVAHFVEVFGLDYFDESVRGMYEITQRHSAEFTVRPFIMRYQERMMPIIYDWTQDPSAHVRRLCSEGTRPRLPWAPQIPAFIADPSPTLPILERLKSDESMFVRKSVANHLNDITKDHPDLALQVATRWSQDATDETRWVIRHALRTLIKKGNPQALGLFGYEAPEVRLLDLKLDPPVVKVPNDLTFSLTLQNESEEEQDILIDYVVHFRLANGKTGPKVFKMTTRRLAAGEKFTLQRKHSFKPITTRRYYAGQHRLAIQVNGQIIGGIDFMVET